MWQMMSRFMSRQTVYQQIHDFKERGTDHGLHADVSGLIAAYKQYINQYWHWTTKQKEQFWTQKVGGLQKYLPMHALQEMTREDRPMCSHPSFKESEFPRMTLAQLGDIVWGLGSRHALVRSEFNESMVFESPDAAVVKNDCDGIASLFRTRQCQFITLAYEVQSAHRLIFSK